MKLKLIMGICLLPLCAAAQTLQISPPRAPAYVLYRLFFRNIAAVDAAAAQSDAAGLPGGDKARAFYQNMLLLTPAQTATLKQSAAQCNQALDQHQQTAQPAIAAVQAANAASSSLPSSPLPFTPPPQLVALEQQRTAISNTCIENLHTALGDRKFADIDVFVRTRFAQKVSAIPPANVPFTNAPVTRMGDGSGK